MNPILYVILNGSLRMSPGKAAAQTAHAVMMLKDEHRKKFNSNYRRTVIVLEASGRNQMDGIVDYLTDAGIDYEYYVDEGVNEVEAFSLTALAVEVFDAEDGNKREIFSSLPLYGESGGFPSATDALQSLSDYTSNTRGWYDVPWFVRRTIWWLRKIKDATR